MDWIFNNSASGNYTTDMTMDTGSMNTIFATTYDNYIPYNELINWLPYKWEKYIPIWHLVKSYEF